MGARFPRDAGHTGGARRGWVKEVMMATYTSADGATFTDEDLERWGSEAENGAPYGGKHLGSSVAGRPISVGVGAKPFTLRLDRSRRAKRTEVSYE